MRELVVTHKFDLVSNMEDVKASIAETIAKYDVVVSEDRIGEAKELMATFNKDKKEFSLTCKTFIDAISMPITEFKAKQKEIEQMYDNGRAKIADQVTKFEAQKLEDIGMLIKEYRDTNCESKQISIESVSVNDLIMLSAVSTNSKGYSLTKKTTDTIDARIQAVENEILKARLEAEEKARHEREIAEKARFEAEERARVREAELIAKAEREKQEALLKAERDKADALARAEREKSEAVRRSEQQSRPIETKEELTPSEPAPIGKRVFFVTAVFEVLASENTNPERIKDALNKKLIDAGITTLKSIEVQ